MAANKMRVDELAPSKTVLLLVDFINPLRFDGADLLAPSALMAARQTARLRKHLSIKGSRTIFANDNYGQWTSDFKELWKRCAALPGAAGHIAKLLKPAADDFTLLKPRHSAFYATPLDILLKQLRCKRLVIAGIACDSCVLFSAMDAYLRDYSLWVPPDCTASETEDSCDRAVEQMRRVLKAHVGRAFPVDPPSGSRP
ncbi:isochorismatase family cysteine hydrolase [Paucibacter sp. R3-3]|uniref:Isochorismatase family cysteine hydrolase n=1 Tax=Roseateles agri TaxID=3098619 RepID=A0ABU5DMP9_9BURK|nr:isochorismatase family cysteine hydrolase [Paucibacter sp. R3-3]MDY0747576.1 isochorismatase family cysteine hydrolase [Paucibacter sp. R3-3]